MIFHRMPKRFYGIPLDFLEIVGFLGDGVPKSLEILQEYRKVGVEGKCGVWRTTAERRAHVRPACAEHGDAAGNLEVSPS